MATPKAKAGHVEVFNNQTVTKSPDAGEESAWIPLVDVLNHHAVNGKFAGTGTLKIEYMVAARADDNYGGYLTLKSGMVLATDTPFHYGVYMIPGYFIKFKVTETGGANDVTGLYLDFVQVGR